MLKRWALALWLAYMFVLTILSFVNVGAMPKLGSSMDDKIYHFIAHTILVLLSYNFLLTTKISYKIIVSAFIAITYGVIIEVLQNLITNSRTSDYFDVLANVFGVIFAVLVVRFTKKLKLK